MFKMTYRRLKVAFYLASQNQMIINGYKKNMKWFYKFCLCMQIVIFFIFAGLLICVLATSLLLFQG